MSRDAKRRVSGDGLAPLEWRTQPLRQITAPATIVFALFLAIILYAVLWARDGLLAGLTVVAMLYVLGPLLVPTQYRLDETGVTRKSPLTKRHFEWSEFKSFRRDPQGRAVFLKFGGRGFGRFRAAITLFVPDAEFAKKIVARCEHWMAIGEDAK